MSESLNDLLAAANQIILGKDRQIRLAVCCLLAKGHLLIEDVPGVGKTTLAHTLARLFVLNSQRKPKISKSGCTRVSVAEWPRRVFEFVQLRYGRSCPEGGISQLKKRIKAIFPWMPFQFPQDKVRYRK